MKPVLPLMVLGLLTALPAAEQDLVAITPGSTVTFTTSTVDQFGNRMDADDLVAWVATGGTVDRSVGGQVAYAAGQHEGRFVIIANCAGLTAKRWVEIDADAAPAESRATGKETSAALALLPAGN